MVEQIPDADLTKPVSEWGRAEMLAAVTAMSLYRSYLERELGFVAGFLNMPAIDQDPNYSHAKKYAQTMMEEQCRECDPAWSAALLRTMLTGSKALAG